MRTLAIESSSFAGSVALLEHGRALTSLDLSSSERSARTLAPAIQSLLEMASWKPSDVRLVATTVGPGSFTGLRVGVTTAKSFAFAIGAEIIGVDTLTTVAWQCPDDISRVWTAIDAQRDQAFVAKFARSPNTSAGEPLRTLAVGARAWQIAQPATIMSIDDLLAKLNAGDAIAGPLADKLADRLAANVKIVRTNPSAPHAIAVGQLAWQLYQSGRRDDPFQLTPLYLRRTAAEEQWERLGRA